MKRCRHQGVKSNRPVLNAVRSAASLAAVAIAARWGIAPTAAFADTNILSGTTLNIPGPTLVDNDRILINSDNGGGAAILFFGTNSTSVSGTGTIQLNAVGNIPARAQLNSATNVTVTLGSGILTHGFGQINAFVINNGIISADVGGADLQLLTSSMTNNATIQAINGGLLDVSGITLNQGTSGVLFAANSSFVQLIGGATISGGTIASGSSSGSVQASGVNTLNSVKSTAAINILNSSQLNFTGSGFTNSGVLTINSNNGGGATIASVNNSMTFSGTGSINLFNTANAPVRAQLNTGAGAVLTLASSQLVHGLGQINASLINNGTVSADVNGGELVLQTLSITNNATLQAFGGGQLDVNGIAINQSGTGLLTAANSSSVQIFGGATISGGTFSTTGNGVIAASGTSNTLNSVINTGTLNLINASQLNFTGAGFTNSGVLTINSNNAGGTTIASINNSMTFSGTGSVNLFNTANAPARAQLNTGAGAVLTIGSSQLVHGLGLINAQLVNNGTITADVSGGQLILQTSTMTNNATIQAVGGATLDISAITLNQGSNGVLFGDNSSAVRFVGGDTINSGTLRSGTAGVVQAINVNTLNNVSNTATLNLLNGGLLNFMGGFTNNGTLTINADNGGGTTIASVNNSMTWSGTGSVNLYNTGNIPARAQLNTGGTAILTVGPSMLVHGVGQINAQLVNNGTISSDFSPGYDLFLQTSPMTNNALMNAINGAHLDISGIVITQGATGSISAVGTNGSLVSIFGGATISGGKLTTSGNSTIASSGTAANTLNSIDSSATINILNGSPLNFTGAGFTNNGTLTINADNGGGTTIASVNNSMTWSGTGSVNLYNTANVPVRAQVNTGGGAILTVGNSMLIHGVGQINAQLVNNGTISSDFSPGYDLFLQSASKTNNATMNAINGAHLNISGITVNQTGAGIISAGSNGSLVQLFNGGAISGGLITTFGNGAVNASGAIANTLNSVNSSATINILNGSPLNFTGAGFTNNGTLTINADNGGGTTIASVNNSMTWSGTGSVNLYNTANVPVRAQIISPTSGVTLTIGSGQTIHGSGIIAVGGLINNGNILADVAGSTLSISTTGFTNNANLTVTNTAFLPIGGGALISTGTVTVGDGSTLSFAAAPTHVADSVKTLTITSTGLVDIQNHFLSIDNTATPFPKVKQYIDAAYNRSGIAGDYNGRGGITSSVAKTNVTFMGVGYYNGALQNPANPDYVGQVLGPNSNSGAGTGIPLSQILVRPTLTGDLNGDGVVNSYDVNLFNTFGLFGSPTNLGYQAGDLNGDGVVNANDVNIFNSAGNFNNGSYLVATASAKVAKAASTLTGRSASPAAVLNPDLGTLAFQYDPATGDVHVKYNGFTGFAGKQTFNTTNRALSLIDILSTGGAFALDSTHLTPEAKLALSSTTFTGNTEINLTAVNGYLPDGTDLGRILAPGLDPQQLAGALTLSFNYTGSRQLSGGVAGLIVPEPATLSLLGLGAMGLLSRRRRPVAH